MQKYLFALIIGLVCAFAQPSKAQKKMEVDLVLVLAADTSGSIDERKYALQVDGYRYALSNRRVINAMLSGPLGRVAICYFEWAGGGLQAVRAPWTLIDSPQSALGFSQNFVELSRVNKSMTSISDAIAFGTTLIENAPYTANRKVIDITGDGTNNSGPSLPEMRARALERGIVINALAILTANPIPRLEPHVNPPGGLEEYFRQNVIGGPGSFALAADSFETFGQYLARKLILEIASR